MSDLLDDLKNKWENARPESSERSSSAETISLAKKKMKSVLYGHYGNIAILTITLIGISAFFVYVAPLQHTLSHVGIFLMLGGLLLRILIECYSILRSSKVDMSDATAIVNEKTLAFYAYRKRIHGPVTIGILAAYTIGFYMLTPEFANYFTTAQVVIMDISYLGAAAIFGYSIRRAIRDEMRLLGELKHLHKELKED
jgi:cation transport ATPase